MPWPMKPMRRRVAVSRGAAPQMRTEPRPGREKPPRMGSNGVVARAVEEREAQPQNRQRQPDDQLGLAVNARRDNFDPRTGILAVRGGIGGGLGGGSGCRNGAGQLNAIGGGG